jgi:hypothetical protein
MVDFSPVEDTRGISIILLYRKLALLERAYYARQMKNLKAFIPIEWMTADAFTFYCWATGALLARAHARTGDAAIVAGYCGRSRVLGESSAEWAELYGDQTEKDHCGTGCRNQVRTGSKGSMRKKENESTRQADPPLPPLGGRVV